MRTSNFAIAQIQPFAAGATTAALSSGGDGIKYPLDVPFWVTVYKSSQYSSPASDPKVEIFRVDSFNQGSGVFNVIARGQLGTSDQDHNEAGTYTAVLAPLAHESPTSFNVLSFGAIGDGSADDTAAVQATIDAVTTNLDGTGRGGVVFFPLGTYKLTSEIVVPPAVTLRGEALASNISDTSSTLQIAHSGSGVRFARVNASPGNLFHMGGIDSMSLRGQFNTSTTEKLIVLGDPANVDSLHGAWNTHIRNCSFRDTYHRSIYVYNGAHSIVENCYFNLGGIYIESGGNSMIIRDNDFPDVLSTGVDDLHGGIVIDYSASLDNDNISIYGNRIQNSYWGIWATSSKGLKIRDNSFEGVSSSAIGLSRRDLNNTIKGTGCTQCVIDGNYIKNWGNTDPLGFSSHSAIFIIHSSNNYIADNLLDSPNATGAATGAGINFDDDSVANSVSDNIVIAGPVENPGSVPLIKDSSEKQWQTIITNDTVKFNSLTTDPTGLTANDEGTFWYTGGATKKFRFWNGSAAADV